MNTSLLSVAEKISRRRRSRRQRRTLPTDANPRDDQAVKKSARILGPYREKDGYRLIVAQDGQRKSLKFSTAEAAEQAKVSMSQEIARRTASTIAEALAEYEHVLISERGRLAHWVRDERSRLNLFLPVDEPVRVLTAERATELYRHASERTSRNGRRLAVDSLYFLLKSARRFCVWCMERGYLTINPFAKLRKMGRSNLGKSQLTADEARRFLDTALEMAASGKIGAIAVALQLALGLRSSELLSFRVRDLDEGGTVLLIGRGKTVNARRRPEVPAFLRPHLLKITADRAPEEFIFGARPNGERRLTGYLIRQVHQVCRRAGVPLVCAHSLRGLHATLALTQGVSTQAVATALGHGSFAVTARHYADPTQLLNTRVRTVLATLHDPTAQDTAVPELAHAIKSTLSPPQLDHLLRLLASSNAA